MEEIKNYQKGSIQFLDPLDIPDCVNLLREYIYYHKVDYEKDCATADKFGKGLVKEEQFKSILNKYIYPFDTKELELLLHLSPKNYEGFVQYRPFFNGVRRLGKPRTLYSVPKLIGSKYDFHERHQTICAENFFTLKKSYDLRKHDLSKLNLRLLSNEDEEAENLDNYNNKVLLDNFVILTCRDFFKTIKAVYPSKKTLPENVIYKTMGLKIFEKNNFLQP